MDTDVDPMLVVKTLLLEENLLPCLAILGKGRAMALGQFLQFLLP